MVHQPTFPKPYLTSMDVENGDRILQFQINPRDIIEAYEVWIYNVTDDLYVGKFGIEPRKSEDGSITYVKWYYKNTVSAKGVGSFERQMNPKGTFEPEYDGDGYYYEYGLDKQTAWNTHGGTTKIQISDEDSIPPIVGSHEKENIIYISIPSELKLINGKNYKWQVKLISNKSCLRKIGDGKVISWTKSGNIFASNSGYSKYYKSLNIFPYFYDTEDSPSKDTIYWKTPSSMYNGLGEGNSEATSRAYYGYYYIKIFNNIYKLRSVFMGELSYSPYYCGDFISLYDEDNSFPDYNSCGGSSELKDAIPSGTPFEIYASFIYTPEYYFYARSTPAISFIDVPNTINSISHTFNVDYVQPENVDTSYHRFKLYQDGKLIDDTNEIYDAASSYTYSKFTSGCSYELKIEIENIYGEFYENSCYFDVEYSFDDIGVNIELSNEEDGVVINLYTPSILNIEGNITGYEIQREYKDNPNRKSIGVFNSSTIKDYAVKNNTEVRYYIIPIIENENEIVYGSPTVSDWIRVNSYCYSIIGLLPDDNKYTYNIDKNNIWSFSLNIESDSLTLNMDKVFHGTYGRFNKVTGSEKKYISSGIKSLLGKVRCDGDYGDDNADIEKKWLDFCASYNLKFIKDIKGRVFPIDINSCSIETNDKSITQELTVNITYEQIEDIDNITIKGVVIE